MKFVDPKIEKYALEKSTLPGDVPQKLAAFTRAHEQMGQMLIGELEGAFLGFLLRATRAKTVLEVGTFSGYSALAMAENLPSHGTVHTIDIESKEYTERFWKQSAHGHKIVAHRGPALEVIPTIKEPSLFDFIFIDADKENYKNYVELGLRRLSPTGAIAVDNVLWSGRVLKSEKELDKDDTSTRAIQQLNNWVATQDNLYSVLLPIRDGILLIHKKDS